MVMPLVGCHPSWTCHFAFRARGLPVFSAVAALDLNTKNRPRGTAHIITLWQATWVLAHSILELEHLLDLPAKSAGALEGVRDLPFAFIRGGSTSKVRRDRPEALYVRNRVLTFTLYVCVTALLFSGNKVSAPVRDIQAQTEEVAQGLEGF
jgi:hypothetical protein